MAGKWLTTSSLGTGLDQGGPWFVVCALFWHKHSQYDQLQPNNKLSINRSQSDVWKTLFSQAGMK